MTKPEGTVSKPGSSKEYKTGAWRTKRPIFKQEKCNDCRICVAVCPDGIVFGANKKYWADLDYCKGCGICVEECPLKDIELIVEVK